MTLALCLQFVNGAALEGALETLLLSTKQWEAVEVLYLNFTQGKK